MARYRNRADVYTYRKHWHIRDCNKTTDVRTTDSRTGIVPLNTTPSLSFPSSLFLRPSTDLLSSPPCPSEIAPSLSIQRIRSLSPCEPFHRVAHQISLLLSLSLCSVGFSISHLFHTPFLYEHPYFSRSPSRLTDYRQRERERERERSEPRPRFLLKSGGLAWSSAHEFPVTFRNTARILSME